MKKLDQKLLLMIFWETKMPTYNEITLAKELIKFPSITPIDAGVMKFLAKKLSAIGFKCKILEFKDKNSKPVKNFITPASIGVMLGNLISSFANVISL